MKFKLSALFTLIVFFSLLLVSCEPVETEPDDPTPTPSPEGVFTPTPEEGDPEPTEEPQPTPEVGLTPTPPPDASPTPTVEVDDLELPETGVDEVSDEVIQFEEEWPVANKDYSNTRATFDSEITSDNVNDLELTWSYPITGIGPYGGAAGNTLIANNIVYFQDLQSNIIALDLETGEVIWEHEVNQAVVGPNGPAIGYGKLFAQVGVHRLRAINLETGEEIWTVLLQGPSGAHQPYVYSGYVLTGLQAGAVDIEAPGHVNAARGYSGGTSGFAYAIDQETGEEIWSFQTVEEGFWGNPDVNSGGGIWYPPAIDPERELTFWSTGNPAPFPGTVDFPNGTSRPGDNLYTNTMLALDLHTGELVWHNQVLPHDIFDLDFQVSPILATAEIEGQERDIVLGSGKLGRVYAFDRDSGEMLWETPVGIHQNDELTEIPMGEEILVYPGVWGGVETPMSYADGGLYVPVVNLPTPYTATGHDAEDGVEAVANASGRTELPEGTGEFVAIDVTNGEILWSVELDTPPFGGATVVNDLVFFTTFDGIVYAYDREDGTEVWSYQAPNGIIAWPSVAGDTIVFAAGVGEEPQVFALRLP
jgi:outer membrane protein assembly factor BamB